MQRQMAPTSGLVSILGPRTSGSRSPLERPITSGSCRKRNWDRSPDCEGEPLRTAIPKPRSRVRIAPGAWENAVGRAGTNCAGVTRVVGRRYGETVSHGFSVLRGP